MQHSPRFAGSVTSIQTRRHSSTEPAPSDDRPPPGLTSPMQPGVRFPNPLRRILVVLVAFLGVIAYGTVGYAAIEHWSVLDAVFMTVITITTVGFEEVHALDGAGQAFTVSVIVLG